MLDINLIRTDPEKVKENIRKKFQDRKLPLVDEVLALDEKKELVATLRGNETALHGTDPVAKQREENGHVRFRVDHIIIALKVSKGEKDVHC